MDGEELVLLPHARDHKRLRDGDEGPNTGGMGAISPNPALTDALVERATEEIVRPVLRELARRGAAYRGFLYAGLMLTEAGPQLIEFNVRLGDPEAQVILPRLAAGAALELCRRVATGTLAGYAVEVDPRPVCGVVLAAAGYPARAEEGAAISVGEALETGERWLVHAGTRAEGGVLRVAGGRVAAVVAVGETAEDARSSAYSGVEAVRWEGMQLRRDIGGAR